MPSFAVSGDVSMSGDSAQLSLQISEPTIETPKLDFKALWERILAGNIPVHPSRIPLDRKTLAIIINNIQKTRSLQAERNQKRCVDSSRRRGSTQVTQVPCFSEMCPRRKVEAGTAIVEMSIRPPALAGYG